MLVFWIGRSNTSRYEYMRCQWRTAAWRVRFVEASSSPSVVVHLPGRTLRGPKAGCFLSHLRAIKQANRVMRQTGENFSVIMEDDVDVLSGLQTRRSLPRELRALPVGWEVAQLGYHTYHWDALRQRAHTRYFALDRLRRPVWSLFAYAISRDAARRVTRAARWRGTVVHTTGCRAPSADGCLMNGDLIGRPWRRYLLTPPVFWEPLEANRTAFASTVGSNSAFHAYCVSQSVAWNRAVFGPIVALAQCSPA